MAKRGRDEDAEVHGSPPVKRPFHESIHSHQQSSYRDTKSSGDYAAAFAQLPAPVFPTLVPSPQHSDSAPTFTNGFPNIPPLSEALAAAPFKHKSTLSSYDRTDGALDLSYERLEFLGDAYLELYASRLIFSRYSHLPAGRMSQLRELLVKNETLAEYATLYGFDRKVEILDKQTLLGHHQGKKNKGFNKVLGDVFEAYVAAVVMSDSNKDSSQTAEAWLTALWSVKLIEQEGRDDTLRPPPQSAAPRVTSISSSPTADRQSVPQQPAEYSATGKSDLQRRIGSPTVTLRYEQDRPSVEMKGNQLGQSRHFVALYLTGYGYERKLLGKGEGKSKAEAGNRAAVEAMYGKRKAIVDECEATLKLERAAKAERKAAQAAELEAKRATNEGEPGPEAV